MRRALRREELILPGAAFAAGFLVHLVEGLLIAGPWLLPDEVHGADGARSLVSSGRAGFRTAYSLVTAPVWLGGTSAGYALAKTLGALAVAAAAFPAYRLAREVAPPRLAALAALVAVLVPETLFASAAVPIALAYPLAAAGTLFLVRFLDTGAARDGVAAFAGLALAAACWPALVIVLLPAALLAYVWRLGRRALTWPAAVVFAVLPAVVYAALVLARVSSASFRAAADEPWHIPARAGAGLGALAVGLGLAPLVAAIAVALVPRRRPAFAAVLLVELVALAAASGIEAAGHAGGSRPVDETALAFAVPLVAAAAAGVFAARRLETRPLAVAALVALGCLALVPVRAASHFDPHAPGVSAAGGLGVPAIGFAVAFVVFAAVVLVALGVMRGSESARLAAPALVAALAVLAALTGEIVASARAGDAADATARLLPRPLDWLQRLAGGKRVIVAAGPHADRRTIDGLLFWNRNAVVLDPPLRAREVDATTGAFSPPLPSGLVLDAGGSQVAGKELARTPLGPLVAPSSPARTIATAEGIYPDGWSGGEVFYRRFGGASGPGTLRVAVSRRAWHGPSKPAQVVIDASPINGPAFSERILHIDSGQEHVVDVPVPAPPFQVKVAIGPLFSPADYGGGDTRKLGAQLSFHYRPG